jgi:lysophospholipase L1-like esterase
VALGVLAAALGVVAALALPVLAELVARGVLRRWGGYYRYTPYWRERHEFDRALLPTFPPTSMVEINADGERGGPPPREGERVFRGLVVGGSAAECYFLDQDATWPAVVERILNAPEHLAALGVERAHVGNVSRAIVPCAQLVFMLSKILPRYRRLDVALIMVGGSDVVSWMERGTPREIAPAHFSLDRMFEQHPEGPWGWKLRQTALWRIASQLNRRLRRPVVPEPDSSGWLRKVRKMRADAPHRIDEVPDATPMLDHFATHLAALIRVARTKAARVIVVRQPWFGPTPTPEEEALMWNFAVGRPYREEVTTYFTSRVVDAVMRLVDERAVAVAAELGAEQVELMSTLEHSARTFYDELHFTPEGSATVGRHVATAIVGRCAKPP